MNKIIRSLTAKNILEYTLIIPNFQRIIDSEKVEDIVKYQLDYIKKHSYHNFIGTINIHHLTPTKEYYLVDGQHRFQAIKILYEKYSHNYRYNVEFVDVGSREQLRENFGILNQNTPLPEFPPDIDKSIPEKATNYFQYKYPNVWSKTAKARRPRIFLNHFQETLGVIVRELKIEDSDKLISLIEEKNIELSERDFNVSETMMHGAKENNFYLGLFLHSTNNDHFYEWAGELIGKNSKKVKERIPAGVRNDIWEKHVGEKYKSKCPVCNQREITTINFEAGHIISDKDGGGVNVDNLIPICGKCNKSMGAENMLDYVKQYYPKNYNKFLSK